MSLLQREVHAFPSGDNSSDTVFGGVHWNLTTLQHWNYSLYSNHTLSNGSKCFLLFEPYTPHLLSNGTFLNSTSCYSPVESIKARSKIGLAFAVFFGVSVVFTLANLRKHGKKLLAAEKRFYPIGRRWQWYWMLAVATSGFISGIAGVDVDRYYLPELPVVLASFFWMLMLPTTMCVMWESVRHWGSWQERQMIDPNPHMLSQDDRRSKVEFYIPLVFYFCAWMNFFMIVPRSWRFIELQRDPQQARRFAEPSATDLRFKLAALFILGSWLVTVFSLHHSIKHYKARNRGMLNRVFGLFRYIPTKYLFTIPLSLVMIGYESACAFDFSISPLNIETNVGIMYGLGWCPIALIFIVFEIWGYIDPNEDREIIQQRRDRNRGIDQEIGIVKKPHWWSSGHGFSRPLTVREALARNVSELRNDRAATQSPGQDIELSDLPNSEGRGGSTQASSSDAMRMAGKLLFSANANEESHGRFTDHPQEVIPQDMGREQRPETSGRDSSNDSNDTQLSFAAKPQQVKSMLDV